MNSSLTTVNKSSRLRPSTILFWAGAWETGLEFDDDDVHHPERKRPVGSGLDCDVPIRLLGGARAHGVDDYDLCTLLLGLEYEGPTMQVSADHVHAPHDDVLRVAHALDIQAAGRPDRHDPSRGGAGLAIGLLGDGRSQPVEE